jgi:hypothetical protein
MNNENPGSQLLLRKRNIVYTLLFRSSLPKENNLEPEEHLQEFYFWVGKKCFVCEINVIGRLINTKQIKSNFIHRIGYIYNKLQYILY